MCNLTVSSNDCRPGKQKQASKQLLAHTASLTPDSLQASPWRWTALHTGSQALVVLRRSALQPAVSESSATVQSSCTSSRARARPSCARSSKTS